MSTGRVAFHTLGCKLNYAETSTIGKSFTDHGYTIAPFREQVDVVVINTCTVTENADRECRKIIRQARRRSPKACVIVVGCYAELKPESIAEIEGVDLILGSNEKFHIFDYLPELVRQASPRIATTASREGRFEPALSHEDDARTRAFLKVQDGCDYTCAYCTIPFARGGSRSARPSEVVDMARSLAESGYREIVLSGVNVGDFGRGTDGDLLHLLKDLVAIDPSVRYRVSSIEPNLLTDAIIEFAQEYPSVCPHFHLPLQSGSPAILRAMKRRYTTHVYRDRVEKVMEKLPHACIGADVIVGFPGETRDFFEETYAFLRDLPLGYLHVFPYSPRPGTLAATLKDEPAEVKSERVSMLHILSEKKRRAFMTAQLGTLGQILFEKAAEGWISGLSENYVRVAVPYEQGLEGTVHTVRMSELSGTRMVGRVMDDGGFRERP